MEKLAGVFEQMREAFAALDLENPVWAVTAAVVVTLLFVVLISLVRRTARRVASSIENARSEGRITTFKFQRQDLLEAEPTPFVLVTSLDDFYVSYELNAHTRRAQTMPATYSALHANILDRFHEAGVEILSPHYAAIRDGSRAALPPSEEGARPGVPPFRIQMFGGQGEHGDP